MEIDVFSRQLLKIMKTAGNVKIIQTNLIMNDFTLHGLHLNISGKENMAEWIGEKIKRKQMSRIEETPISLKWGEIKRILLRN